MRPIALAMVLLAAACATTDAPGTYEVITPDAGGLGERHVRVSLRRDNTAAVSTAFSGRPSRSLLMGAWQREDNRITVTLHDEKRVVFRLRGDQLVPEEWDRATWGDEGPGVLFRVFLSDRR